MTINWGQYTYLLKKISILSPIYLLLTFAALAEDEPAGVLLLTDFRCPTIVYSEEKNNICIGITNSGKDDAEVSVELMTHPEGAAGFRTDVEFTVRAGKEDSALVPLDMVLLHGRAGKFNVSIRSGDMEIGSKTIVVRDSLSGLHGIRTEGGRLYTEDGELCIICILPENPSKYRKWAPIKWVKKRGDTSPKKVFLLGSAMVNTLDEKEGPFVDALKGLVEKEEESFEYELRRDGLRPVFEDMLKMGKVLDGKDVDIFIFAPGVEDLYANVPVRDFERGLDVLIDQVRAGRPAIRLVLVTPVPFLQDMKLTEEYEDAMKNVATDHHADLVDLRKVLGRYEWSLRKNFGNGDSQACSMYPLEKGQELIARGIKKYVY